MIKIDPKVFDNQLYKLEGSKDKIFQLSYIDNTKNWYQNTTVSNTFGVPSLAINLSNKTIKLSCSLSFSIPEHYNIPQLMIYDHIKDVINKEFINKITQLGRIHVDSIKKEHYKELDLLIYNNNSYNEIVYKIQNSSSFIAADGLIGPAQWMISNSKTYKNFLVMLSQNAIFDKNGMLKVGDISYILNENVSDDIVLLGIKSVMNNAGVFCFIETDEYGYIKFNKSTSYGSIVNYYTINYAVEDVGLNPENKYLTLNTRTPNYYRYLKLKKIQEIYGN